MKNNLSDFEITLNDDTYVTMVSANITIGDKFVTLISFNGNNKVETRYLPIDRIKQIVEIPNFEQNNQYSENILEDIQYNIHLAKEEKIFDSYAQEDALHEFLFKYINWEKIWLEPNTSFKVGDIVEFNWKGKIFFKGLKLPKFVFTIKEVLENTVTVEENDYHWNKYFLTLKPH